MLRCHDSLYMDIFSIFNYAGTSKDYYQKVNLSLTLILAFPKLFFCNAAQYNRHMSVLASMVQGFQYETAASSRKNAETT